MQLNSLKDTFTLIRIRTFLIVCLFLYSCNITRKAPKDKPYLIKNSFEVKGGNFSKLERSALADRLAAQLDDSSTLKTTDVLFFFTILKRPPAYDTAYSAI